MAATKKTWREHMALTTSTSVDNIANFKWINMGQYWGQQPKVCDVYGSREATEGAWELNAAR